jgi:hypothetical protein
METAATGLIVSGLNHVAHQMGDGDRKEKGKTLKDLKVSPPDHPEYVPPKGGARKVKNPNGQGSGWIDKDGRVWVPTDHGGTHAPHWDRQEPKGGGYTNVYPKSECNNLDIPTKRTSDYSQMGENFKTMGIILGSAILVGSIIYFSGGTALLAL